MPLDLPTLFLVSTCVTALLGLFLFVLWLQDRSVRALGYWASAYLIGGFAIALWVFSPNVLPAAGTDLASALLFTCCGLIWCGARKFHGREVSVGFAIAGAVAWLVATRMPELMQWDNARVVISSLIITTYAVLTAIELRRERRRPKGGTAAQARALTIPALHGVIFLSPILTTTLFTSAAPIAANGFFPLFALLTLLYVVGTAFIVVVMAKEHSALVHKTAAMTDPLTGLFNRRGFFEAAEKLVASQRKSGQPVTIMMFDLDHFKSINDRFGHDTGDEALQTFAATASSNMRLNDVVGRLGGEEFAAMLPGGIETALMVGERVRAAFEARGVEIAGHVMNATVSIGVTESLSDVAHIQTMLARADRALYAAKAHGRNRVCTDKDARDTTPVAPPLVPVAGELERDVSAAEAAAVPA
jgi:diguanylate cyclase (GGDEF)-like protein